jgi:hypothetical protein
MSAQSGQQTISGTDPPYTVAVVAYALNEDPYGIAPTAPGPCGWGAVVRRGDRCAEYRLHACHSTREQLYRAAAEYLEVTFMGRPYCFVTEATHPEDVARARLIARTAALLPHEPTITVVR